MAKPFLCLQIGGAEHRFAKTNERSGVISVKWNGPRKEWLGTAFGFQTHLVLRGEAGTVAHAQLVLAGGTIMLDEGSGREGDEYERISSTLNEIDGINTMGVYLFIEQIDTHYERAKAAGARMVLDIQDQAYGGRGYTCTDLEGHLWSFGSYDPWA